MIIVTMKVYTRIYLVSFFFRFVDFVSLDTIAFAFRIFSVSVYF